MARGEALATLVNARADHDYSAEAMDVLRRVVRALHTIDLESEAAIGVGAAQLFVLREIEKGGTLTVSELASRTATAQSSVSEVVARLVGRGLVARARAAGDRRRAELTLTATGQALLATAPRAIQERLVAAFRALPPDRQRRLAQDMSAWVAAAGLGNVTPTMFFEGGVEGN